MNHPSFGKVPPEAMQAALEAPAGEATRIIRRFEPSFGIKSEDVDAPLLKWKVTMYRNTSGTQIAKVEVEAQTREEAEELASAMDERNMDWETDDYPEPDGSAWVNSCEKVEP